MDANPASKAFSERYQAADKAAPDMNPAWVYDAMHLLARAIQDAGSTGPERVRSAFLAVWGHMGVEGGYGFDANGDGLHGYNVVRNDRGELVFVRRVNVPAG